MRGWPFVGREVELEKLRAAFAGDDSSGIVVFGDVGVGKTRLARELLSSFAADGRRTSWTAATEALRSIPFGAVAHLLPEDWPPHRDRLAVLSAVAAGVRAMGGRGQVVLGFDDAHLLDEGSAALIGHLAAQRLAFLVVTVRTGAAVPDAVDALWKDGLTDRIDLSGLPTPAVDALVSHALGGDVEGLTRQRLHRAAGGNPLALRELISHATAAGTLHEAYGVWRWGGQARPVRNLHQLVEARLRLLTGESRRVVDVLACGEPLPLALVEAVAGAEAVDAAETDGVMVVERDRNRLQARLAHPYYRDVLRDAMPGSRARRIQRELAQVALRAPLRRRGDALRISLWQVEGGDVHRPDVLRAGAREAIDRSDLPLAERLARAARDAEPGADSDHLLAQILEFRGRSAEAAALLPAEPPPDESPVRWAMTRAEMLYWGSGDVSAAQRVLDTVAADPDGADLVAASRSWILLFDGACPAALEIGQRLAGSGATDPQAMIWASAGGVAAAGFLGRCDEAAILYEGGRAAAVAHQQSLPWGLAQVGYARCLAHLACGELVQADAVAAEGYHRAVAAHAPLMAAGWAGFRGLVAVAAGRPSNASRLLRESIAALAENDTFRLVRCFLGGLAMASALAGDGAGAETWLARADQRATAANRLFAPWLELARAWTAAANGMTGEAATIARRAAELARQIGLPTVEAQARYDAVRLGARGERHRLAELHATLGLPWTGALAGAAEGFETMNGDLLRRASATFSTSGQRLLAAEAATIASAAYRRTGQRGSAAVAAENAAALRTGCEGALTPLLANGGVAGQLTPREAEIARLAVASSSREIAARLGLSPATVNNNLARVYAKLGVTGRSQLGVLLGDAATATPGTTPGTTATDVLPVDS
jgi:DNA-binding CsgD family transcriptional regulator